MSKDRTLNIYVSILPILTLLVAAYLSVTQWKAGMFVPLLLSIVVTAIIALFKGYNWLELQTFMSDGVSRALPAVFILFIIGTIVGTWILSGVIPTIIYYGLAIISPKIFIPTVAFVTGILSLTTGSSFTSIATIGVAFMAIGNGMGFPPALVAGAVISGAYLGDKLSPLSDTTNVAPAMVDTDLFSHVRHMMWDTVPAFLISLVLYWVVGLNYSVHSASTEQVSAIMNGLQKVFYISPILFIIPLFTIFLMLKRYPAIPALIAVTVVAGMSAMVFQGSTLTKVIQVITSGFAAKSGIKAIDSLLSAGGISSMLNTVALLVFATALGGILEGTGIFRVLTDSIVKNVRRTGSLILASVISTLLVGFASGAQFLAIILPARAYAKTYKERGLDTKNLSRIVEAAGTVGINLVPWSVPAIFAQGVLGVSPYAFIPFIFFAFLVPLINVIYGYTGISIAKKNYPETTEQYLSIPSSKVASL